MYNLNSGVSNSDQNTGDDLLSQAKAKGLTCFLGEKILAEPVRLIYSDNSKSDVAFEQDAIRHLPMAICPKTSREVKGYIYDLEKKEEVNAFLAQHPAAKSFQHTLIRQEIIEYVNGLEGDQENILENDADNEVPEIFKLNVENILMLSFRAIIVSAVHVGGTISASSALGASMLKNVKEEVDRQARIAWVGGAIMGFTIDTFVILYAISKFHYGSRHWKYYEKVMIYTIYALALPASIPVGALVLPSEANKSIGVTMGAQLLGATVLAIAVILMMVSYYRDPKNRDDYYDFFVSFFYRAENDLQKNVLQHGKVRTTILAGHSYNSTIPYLQNYSDYIAPDVSANAGTVIVSTTEEPVTGKNPLHYHIGSRGQTLYRDVETGPASGLILDNTDIGFGK